VGRIDRLFDPHIALRKKHTAIHIGKANAAPLPEEARPAFWARLEAVRGISHNIGYGFGDGMNDLLAEYGVDD